MNTYIAAMSVGMRASHTKNPTMSRTEIIRGAMTSADAHPDPEPLVIANMNSTSAAECRMSGRLGLCSRSPSLTSDNKYPQQVKLLELRDPSLNAVDRWIDRAVFLGRDQNKACCCGRDTNDSCEPEDPPVVGELQEDCADHSTEHCKRQVKGRARGNEVEDHTVGESSHAAKKRNRYALLLRLGEESDDES